MKISVTDKFLWELCDFLSATGDLLESAVNARRSIYAFVPGAENPIFKKYRKEKSKREFRNFIYYLKRKGYIRAANLKNKQGLLITKEGINKALKASFKFGERKKRKDGKWVMLIFDIPAKNKRQRNLLKSILLNLGYRLFQYSVWISPYDVSEKTEKLIQVYFLEKYVKIFLIEEI